MPTVVNDAAKLYQAIHAALVKHGAPPAMLAEVDAIFHSPAEEPAAPAARDLRLPADAPANAVVFDTTGKTIADYQAFRSEVGLATPIYNQDGIALDVGMRPITPDNSAPNTDPLAGVVTVLLQNVDSTADLSFNVTEPGSYQVLVGEQYDQALEVNQGGAVVSKSPFQRFSLTSGPGTIHCAFNPDAITPELLASRIAAGQGVSRQYYRLQKIT